jgi:DNA-binding CsgD family transcriptional regulator
MDKKLEIINYSAYQYNKDMQERFNNICAPLYDFGVSRLSYSKTFTNGSYLTLDSSGEYLKQYLSQITNPGDAFVNQLKFTKQLKKKVFFPNSDIRNFDKESDPTIHLLYDNNIWHNLYIATFHDDNAVELFGFSMTKRDVGAASFYINNMQLLERFIEYFKEKASDLIDTKDKSKLAYFGQSFNFYGESVDNVIDDKVMKFLNVTGIENNTFNGKEKILTLAPREIECLKYLALGKNVKQIASTLGLSPRTIEFYINKAKEKTGYTVRQELINEFVKQKLSKQLKRK